LSRNPRSIRPGWRKPASGGRYTGAAPGEARGGSFGGLPRSVLLVRVLPDRLEINEQFSSDRTVALVDRLRELGVTGEVVFRTPCG
jgi:hypothetical protein